MQKSSEFRSPPLFRWLWTKPNPSSHSVHQSLKTTGDTRSRGQKHFKLYDFRILGLKKIWRKDVYSVLLYYFNCHDYEDLNGLCVAVNCVIVYVFINIRFFIFFNFIHVKDYPFSEDFLDLTSIILCINNQKSFLACDNLTEI